MRTFRSDGLPAGPGSKSLAAALAAAPSGARPRSQSRAPSSAAGPALVADDESGPPHSDPPQSAFVAASRFVPIQRSAHPTKFVKGSWKARGGAAYRLRRRGELDGLTQVQVAARGARKDGDCRVQLGSGALGTVVAALDEDGAAFGYRPGGYALRSVAFNCAHVFRGVRIGAPPSLPRPPGERRPDASPLEVGAAPATGGGGRSAGHVGEDPRCDEGCGRECPDAVPPTGPGARRTGEDLHRNEGWARERRDDSALHERAILTARWIEATSARR